jgi:hypothetical protein
LPSFNADPIPLLFNLMQNKDPNATALLEDSKRMV